MNPIRPVALVLLAAAAVSAGGKQDARNTYTPNTDTHFVLPAYGTLAEWQARKVALRQQILSAAGLLPIPPKTAAEKAFNPGMKPMANCAEE